MTTILETDARLEQIKAATKATMQRIADYFDSIDAEQERQAAEIAADTEWLGAGEQTALVYGDADLGTRCIVSGGEVIELDAPKDHDSDFASWDDDPF